MVLKSSKNAPTLFHDDSRRSLLTITCIFVGISWQIVDFPGETQFEPSNELKVSRFWSGMSQKYNGFSLGSPAAGDRALLRTELVHGAMHKRMVGIKEHQNTRITEERRRSAQVYERDVVRLELENWCLHPPDGHDYRFRAAFMDVLRSPVHRFTIVWASSENSVAQRRFISGV